jgi:hypothetical protein
MRIEDEVSLLAIAKEVPMERHKEVAGRLLGSLATYHEALPFNEAERRWMHDRYEELDTHPVETDPVDADRQRVSSLRRMDGGIMSAGRVQTVSGQELMQRCWLWRP